MTNEEHDYIQYALDLAEEITLGDMAAERYKNSKDEDYIDIESLLK